MDPRRTSSTLMSLTVSAMLTSAVLATAPGAYTAAAAGPQPRALLNALAGLRAAAWPGAQAFSLPKPPAAVPADAIVPTPTQASKPDSRILSPSEMVTMMQLDVQYGKQIALTPSLTETLGLTTGSEVLTVRQVSMTYPKDPSETDIEHFFMPLDGGDFLFMRTVLYPDQSTVRYRDVYLLDPNQNILVADRIVSSQAGARMTPQEAETRLAIEIHAWRNGMAGKDYNN
jgi:hypothetical protein